MCARLLLLLLLLLAVLLVAGFKEQDFKVGCKGGRGVGCLKRGDSRGPNDLVTRRQLSWESQASCTYCHHACGTSPLLVCVPGCSEPPLHLRPRR
jgi:hypothetical protein